MKVISRGYSNGKCIELVKIPSEPKSWIVAVDGQIPDARRKLEAEEAAAIYDRHPYHIGTRPA